MSVSAESNSLINYKIITISLIFVLIIINTTINHANANIVIDGPFDEIYSGTSSIESGLFKTVIAENYVVLENGWAASKSLATAWKGGGIATATHTYKESFTAQSSDEYSISWSVDITEIADLKRLFDLELTATGARTQGWIVLSICDSETGEIIDQELFSLFSYQDPESFEQLMVQLGIEFSEEAISILVSAAVSDLIPGYSTIIAALKVVTTADALIQLYNTPIKIENYGDKRQYTIMSQLEAGREYDCTLTVETEARAGSLYGSNTAGALSYVATTVTNIEIGPIEKSSSQISLSVTPSSTTVGGSVLVEGSINGDIPGDLTGTINIEYSTDLASWSPLVSKSSSYSGEFDSYRWEPTTPGTYYFRASWNGNNYFIGDTSDIDTSIITADDSEIIDHSMSHEIQQYDPYDPKDRTNIFYTGEDKAISWVKIENIDTQNGPKTVRWEWFEPHSNLIWGSYEHIIPEGNFWSYYCAWSWININDPLFYEERAGEIYQVNVYLDGSLINSESFTITKRDSSSTCALSKTTVPFDESVTIYSTIDPWASEGTIKVEYSKDGSLWYEISSGTPRYGEYSVQWTPPNTESYFLRSKWTGSFTHFESISPIQTLVVEKSLSTVTIFSEINNINYGEPIVLSSSLEPALEGRLITLHISEDNENWTDLVYLTTDSEGLTCFNQSLQVGNHYLRASWGGDHHFENSHSDSIQVTVTKAKISNNLEMSANLILLGENITLQSSLNSSIYTGLISIQYRSDSNQWTNISTGEPSDGIYACIWAPEETGILQIRSIYYDNTHYFSSLSSVEQLTVNDNAQDYLLRIETIGRGTTNPVQGQYPTNAGNIVDVIPTPESGSDWKFVYWILDDIRIGNEVPLSVTMNTNHNLTAVFMVFSDIWWNPAWTKKKQITITENSGHPLSDFPITLTLDTSALVIDNEMKSDCSDIRIINEETMEALEYALLDENTKNTQIIFKTNLEENEVQDNIFIYYDNPDATPVDTLLNDVRYAFWDDFDGTLDDNWDSDNGVGAGYSEVTDGYLKQIAEGGEWRWPNVWTKQDFSYTQGWQIKFSFYNDDGNAYGMFLFGDKNSVGDLYLESDRDYKNTIMSNTQHYKTIPSSIQTYDSESNQIDTTYGDIQIGWQTQEIIFDYYSNEIHHLLNGILTHTLSASNVLSGASSDWKIGHLLQGGSARQPVLDYVYVSAWTSFEPTITVGLEEKETTIKYTLTVSLSGTGAIDPNPGEYEYNQGDSGSISASDLPDWSFSHWMLDGTNIGSTNPVSIDMDTDHSVTAVFIEIPPPEYQLTIINEGYGTTGPNNPAGVTTHTEGQTIEITADPNTNYILSHWLLDGENAGNNPIITITMNTDHIISAVFIEDPDIHWIYIEIVGEGTTTPSEAVQRYTNPAETLEALPADGWILSRWLLDDVNVGNDLTLTFNLDRDVTITAVFTVEDDSTELTIDTPYPTTLISGEPDWYRFTNQGTTYLIETTGGTDVNLYLYDTDKTTILDQDTRTWMYDSSIIHQLTEPGTYYVKVEGKTLETTGPYTITVNTIPEGPYIIQGTVYYSTTTIPNVQVDLIPGDWDNPPTQQTQSNEQGEYLFTGVSPGHYYIKFYGPSKEFYDSTSTPRDVIDQDIIFDMFLKKVISTQYPEENAEILSTNPTLIWENLLDVGYYNIILWHAGERIIDETSNTNEYSLTYDLTVGEEYEWYVIAYDSTDNRIGSTFGHSIFNVIPSEWSLDLTLTLEQYVSTLTLGVNQLATSGFDLDYDLITPPQPPTGIITYFWYPENPETPIDFRKLGKSIISDQDSMIWELHLMPKNIAGSITVSWDQTEIEKIPANYNVLLQSDPGNTLVDMRTTSQYSYLGESDETTTLMVAISEGVEVSINLLAGWNLISVPLLPDDPSVETVFGDVGYYQVVSWNGQGYESVSMVEPGKGYWVLVLQDSEVIVTGLPVGELELTLMLGWNMVGGTNQESDLSSKIGEYHQCVGWSGVGYEGSQGLQPCKGYWVLVLVETRVILP